MRRTKIVCTIGPASRPIERLESLVRSGMDVARINFSHGDPATHATDIRRVREVAERAGRTVAVQADLQGPKFRVGDVGRGGVTVRTDDTVVLSVLPPDERTRGAVPLQNRELPDLVRPHDRILIDDGLIELTALAVSDGEITCRVAVGGVIQASKGVNLPGVSADLPALTHKDREDLVKALEWDVDWLALSFVRRSDDVLALRRLVEEHAGRFVPLMAKIEKPEALDHVDEIVDASDAVMLARGDLGIEIPAECVPMAQKRVIERCNAAGVPVVTATQMLDSMIRNPRPTRAEASDVANAILDGTDAVMLSGETAIGLYPVEAVETMVRIANQVELERPPMPWLPAGACSANVDHGPNDIESAIARALGRATRQAADELPTAAVIAITSTGYTARLVSRYRPNAPILSVTSDERVMRQLQLCWGVTPLSAPRTSNTDEMIAEALRAVRRERLVEPGEVVAIVAATAGSEPGTTDLLRLQVFDPSAVGP